MVSRADIVRRRLSTYPKWKNTLMYVLKLHMPKSRLLAHNSMTTTVTIDCTLNLHRHSPMSRMAMVMVL